MPSANWTDHFPGLKKLEPEIARPLVETSKVVTLPAGTRIFGPGQSPESYLLLIDGTVRVQQVSETGREIVLYRVSAGESCALTTACLMGYEEYQAEGVTETDHGSASHLLRRVGQTSHKDRKRWLAQRGERPAHILTPLRLPKHFLQDRQGRDGIGAQHPDG